MEERRKALVELEVGYYRENKKNIGRFKFGSTSLSSTVESWSSPNNNTNNDTRQCISLNKAAEDTRHNIDLNIAQEEFGRKSASPYL